MRLDGALRYQAVTQGDSEALLFEGSRFSWRDLDAGVNRVANALLALGAQPGDRVILLMQNSVAFIETYYALARIGCISAPVMPTLTGTDVTFIANTLRARFAIVEAAAAGLWREVADKVPSVEAAIGFGAGHGLPLDFDTLRAAVPADDPGVDVDPSAPLTVKFTSGTTGTPKGCVRSHVNFTMASVAVQIETPLRDDDVGLIAQPFAAGMAVSLLTMYVFKGVRMVVLPQFDAGKYLDLVESERVTHAAAMDWMARRISAHPSFPQRDLSSIRILHGINQLGSLVPIYAQGTFKGGVTAGYASSEAGGLVTFKTPAEFRRVAADPDYKPGHSNGRPGRLHQIECMDENMRPLPPNTVGELAIRGPTVFGGYWERPEETAKVLRDGWLLTGDLAEKDDAGYLYLRGRKRDMIRTGGLNVYPAEIEPLLVQYPGVTEAAVIGVPDVEWGERVVACLVATREIPEADMLAYCRARFAPHKRPKNVIFFDTFPLTGSGKVMKKDLIDRVAALLAKETS